MMLPLFVFTWCCALFGNVVSLKVLKLIAEPHIVEGQSTVMECKFDLEGSSFGSTAWGKDGEAFFVFSRRRVPPKEVFPVPGVNLDVGKSNQTHVVLKKLTLKSSGLYGCTVTNSGGGSQISAGNANITVSERDPIPLLTATRKGLFVVDTKNYSAATAWKDAPPVLSVGYHWKRNKLYYGASGGNIINQDYDHERGMVGALILSEEGVVTSIAVDWLQNILYFTDDYLDSVGRVNLTTEGRTTLLDSSDGVKNPESIVVDPFQGFLFWGDNSEEGKRIVASGLDGKTNRQTIVDSNIKRAILALDLERRRLYFISNGGLTSCKYDGSKQKVHFHHSTLDNNVNSISYFDNYIFWSRYETGKTSSGIFYVPFTEENPAIKELPIKSILDVKVFHQDLQKQTMKYSCELIECSHDCVLDAKGSAECVCPDGYSLSAEGTTCNKGRQGATCEDKSLTTVNSKPVCKGDIVFEDKFDQASSSIDVGKWQHTIRISSDHEQEFVIFDKDLENTYVKDGNLVITPKIISDSIVTDGNVSLIGCTSPIPHLCQKEAFSYSIIPPVRSGLLNTGHSFNFRYGIVTIRAKVPKGDWLFPVFNLHATKDFYNPDCRSGVMRLVSVKGNNHLTCGGREIGNKNMAAGVMLGQLDKVKSYFVNNLAERSWSDNFHTYQFTWTPDELSVSVDNLPKKSIIPEGKTLREVLGFTEEESLDEWKQGRLAPLDQDFYLSIGVSVGGALEYPDDCTDAAKPWRNFQVKSLLNFWQNKSSWSQTWKDQPALLVDYINVKALP